MLGNRNSHRQLISPNKTNKSKQGVGKNPKAKKTVETNIGKMLESNGLMRKNKHSLAEEQGNQESITRGG